MEFASFQKFNGQLTVHFFTNNLEIYALDGSEKAIQMWEAFSKEDKEYFVSREWDKQNMPSKNEIVGQIMDDYDKYNF
jgi:antitoxin component HigA of HigAB toxin-antitoxin module